MLKNITLSVLCVFCMILPANAQFSIDKDTLKTSGYVASFVDLAAYTKIRNTSLDTVKVIWTRTTESIPVTWTSAVCDVNTCHGSTVNTGEFALPPYTVGNLSFHFYPEMNKGTGKMIVRFAMKSNPSYFVDVVINSQAYGLGLNNVSAPTLNVYPNPATKTITLGNESIKDGYFEIYNLLGEKVLENAFIATQKFDISTLPKGIYFIKIRNENSSSSGKLVIE